MFENPEGYHLCSYFNGAAFLYMKSLRKVVLKVPGAIVEEGQTHFCFIQEN
jgi:hypothetical protein